MRARCSVESGNRTHDFHANTLAHYQLDYQSTQRIFDYLTELFESSWNLDFLK